MGRSLARRMAARGDELCLLGRDLEDQRRTALDLSARADTSREIPVHHCDLEQPDGFAQALRQCEESLAGLDCVVITAAVYDAQEKLEADTDWARRLMTINFSNTVAFCEEARKRLLALGGGTLCVFSSVAGERGRKPVVIYGASKAGLSAYLEGLDHKFRAEGLRTVCIKPGFVKTGMTAGLKPPPFAGEPDQVAGIVLKAIDRGKPVAYAPGIWALVMFAIRCLPRFVMRKIGF